MVEKIKKHFYDGIFSSPAKESDIINVEKVLGIKMPHVLRELYLAFDGFREGIGNSTYLLPLIENRGSSSVIEVNKFLWDEYKEYYPSLNLEQYLFFGISSGDENWGIKMNTMLLEMIYLIYLSKIKRDIKINILQLSKHGNPKGLLLIFCLS